MTSARPALDSTADAPRPSATWGPDDPAVDWLLRSTEPAVRYRTLTEVMGLAESDGEVRAARAQIVDGPKVQEIFAARNAAGTWGDPGPGRKYTGTPHVLAVLAALRVPGTDERLQPAIDQYLSWLPVARKKARSIDGRLRDHMGREGVALDIGCVFGMEADPRIRGVVDYIIGGQWPDGGWNCDKKPAAYNSSFIETFSATRGLFRYAEATGDVAARDAALASADIFVRRGVIRSERSGNLISGRFLQLHWPRGYDVLAALEAIVPGGLDDPRLDEALNHLERRRDKRGRWRANGPKPRVAPAGSGEVADFSDGLRDEMVTLRALAVLRAAGRTRTPPVSAKTKPRPRLRRTSTETLNALLADAGAELEVVSIEKLSRDEDGEYSRVKLEDGTSRLFREYATTTSGATEFLMKESFLFDVLRSAGLPTPEVLASVAGSRGAGGDPAAMLLTDAGGVPLAYDGRLGRAGDLYLSVSGASADALWAEVGSMLGRLHDVDVAVTGMFATACRDTPAEFLSDWFKHLKRIETEHPIAAAAVAELRLLRRPLRDFLEERPLAIRSGSTSYLPGLVVEREGSRWRTAAWVSWGYYACAGDPLRDVVTVQQRHREWVGGGLPASFYEGYGHEVDPLARLIYTTATRCWARTIRWGPRHEKLGYVPPFPDPVDPGDDLSAAVEEIKDLIDR